MATYRVRKGDTLSAIARRTGVSVNKLARLNGIKNRNSIQAGAALKLPSANYRQPAVSRKPAAGSAAPPNYRQPAVGAKKPVTGATAPKYNQPAVGPKKPLKPPTKPWQDQLDGAQRNAYAALENLFKSYGLGSLAPKILDYVKKGYDQNTVSLLLQDTSEWKARFKGNELRRQQGMNVLSPAEYLQMENSYRSTMQAYGMPKNFYDSPDDYAGFIGNEVSPEEVRSRAAAAWNFAQSTNNVSRRMLKDYYGVDESHIAAYFLDPKKGQAVIERQAAAAGYGGIAARQGLGAQKSQAESWVDRGISAQQVEQGTESAATVFRDMDRIGNRFDEDYTGREALDEFVGGLASSRRKRERLAGKESALFGGATGTAGIGGGRDAGSF